MSETESRNEEVVQRELGFKDREEIEAKESRVREEK